MKTALVTGISGFVGSHLALHLLNQYHIVGVDRSSKLSLTGLLPFYPEVDEDLIERRIETFRIDLNNVEKVDDMISAIKPDFVFHLAGNAFVPSGWTDPAGMLESNTLSTAHLLQAIRNADYSCRFLLASSAEVYGPASNSGEIFTEESPTIPMNPYASSKLAAEHFCLNLSNDKLHTIVARPFNHVGPGQKDSFAIPSFLKEILKAKKNKSESIPVGDLNSTRDFTDVRDVIRAYHLLTEEGTSGKVYNISSGRSVPIHEVLSLSMEACNVHLETRTDPARLRPEGSTFSKASSKPLNNLGWKPEISLKQSIIDTLQYLTLQQKQELLR